MDGENECAQESGPDQAEQSLEDCEDDDGRGDVEEGIEGVEDGGIELNALRAADSRNTRDGRPDGVGERDVEVFEALQLAPVPLHIFP